MFKTEFLLSLVATLVGLTALALPAGDAVNICGAVLAGFAALGYNARRAGVKIVEDAIAARQKPGYKTTEFWLSAVASIGGCVQTVLADGSTAQVIAGSVLGLLAASGYVSKRSEVKKAGAEALERMFFGDIDVDSEDSRDLSLEDTQEEDPA